MRRSHDDELIEEATSSHGVLRLKAKSMKRSLADWHKLPLIFLWIITFPIVCENHADNKFW